MFPGPLVIKDWSEDEPMPPGYHRAQRTRLGPIIAGAVTLGTLYLFSTLGAAVSADNNPGQSTPAAGLWVPVIGPFIAMTTSSSQTAAWALAVDGLGQGAGMALLIYGLTSPKTVLIRNEYGLRVVPHVMPTHDGGTFGFAGVF